MSSALDDVCFPIVCVLFLLNPNCARVIFSPSISGGACGWGFREQAAMEEQADETKSMLDDAMESDSSARAVTAV
jgi:hypothetical protein